MKLFRNIKFAYQRVMKGYCDKDLWDMDWWFEKTVVPMLKELKSTKHGYPTQFQTPEEWDKVMDEMIHYFEEMNPDTCSLQNEYSDLVSSHILIEQNINKEDRKLLLDKYYEREKEICEYCEDNKEKAFKLFSKYYRDLWD